MLEKKAKQKKEKIMTKRDVSDGRNDLTTSVRSYVGFV